MPIEFLDESKIKKKKEGLELIDIEDTKTRKNDTKKIDETKKIDKKTDKTKKIGFELIDKGKVVICERRSKGMTDNCSLCQALHKELFDRCTNKWL